MKPIPSNETSRPSRLRLSALLLLATVFASPNTPAIAKMVVLSRETTETTADNDKGDGTAGGDNSDGDVAWGTDLEEAYAQAQRLSQPVVVRAGAVWCGWCRRLDEEIAKPQLRKALAKWTRVYLDVDKAPREARALGIGPIPALRLLTPTGKLVASQDGYLSADELVTWLDKHHPDANVTPPPELTGNERPDSQAVVRLVDELSQREPVLREAAIRRLVGHPQVAAQPVAKAFAKGDLATRLATLELLREWKAPIENLDPWQPMTITSSRRDALEAWADRTSRSPATRPAQDDARSLPDARREIALLLRTDSGIEAQAIRERLARLGRDLLPEVYEQLERAATDRDRERLTALRYRLVAPGKIVLSWPGGIERLASTDPETRQQAAEELTRLATPETEPLLLELFSNPDPLVREISLRTLRTTGGQGITDAMVNLLEDPEPNVRAAVLKQLAEDPPSGIAARIADYIAAEKDPDLLVHAIRVLRASRGQAALESLILLADHDTWQVRAEAAEAIGECLDNPAGLSREVRANASVALVKLLNDKDGFVASRAVVGLEDVDLGIAVEPLVKATANHPELADQAMKLLLRDTENRAKVVTLLRQFCAHEHPSIRVAAITRLCEIVPHSADKELAAALSDTTSQVRLAAARAFLKVLESYRPGDRRHAVEIRRESGGLVKSVFRSLSSSRSRRPGVAVARPKKEAASDLDWRDRFRSGQGRPDWMNKVVEPLTRMLDAESREERVAAALCLIPLGHEDPALIVLLAVVQAEPNYAGQAAGALPWLPWEQRRQLFDRLLALNSSPEELGHLAQAMANRPDPRAAPLLWDLIAGDDVDQQTVGIVRNALWHLYFAGSAPFVSDLPSRNKPEHAIADLKARAQAGPEWQRVVALALLLTASLEDAADVAQRIYDNPETSTALRRDAFQIRLLSSKSKQQSAQTALSALADSPPDIRNLALEFLADGGKDFHYLRSRTLPLIFHNAAIHADDTSRMARPIKPEPPTGLEADILRPLLEENDPKTRAYVGHLLVLLGDRDGLEPLTRYWREQAQDDPSWARLVYRAVSVLNDDQLVPVLTSIFESIDRDGPEIREFYWTIRIMDGKAAMQLRKRIRAEVGMDRLR